jgi:hypothetical protein
MDQLVRLGGKMKKWKRKIETGLRKEKEEER